MTTRVVSLSDYVPSPRYDGIPWTAARIEQAAARGGPWTVLETVALIPIDVDPAHPLPRAFTTTQAAIGPEWLRVVFLDAAGNELPTEPIMGTGTGPAYATIEDLTAYLREDGIPTARIPDDEAAERLLARAEREVDRAIGGPPHPTRRRRLEPSLLTAAQAEALARATCAQASFLLEQRPRTLIGADDGLTSIGELAFSARPLPRLGARVLEELAGFGLLARSGTVAPSPVTSDA